MARETGLEHLTMLDMSPPELVSLAAGAGFDAVGLRIAPVTSGEEPWPMDRGSPMLAETVRRSAAACDAPMRQPSGLTLEAPSLAARRRCGPDEYAARARRALAALLSFSGAS